MSNNLQKSYYSGILCSIKQKVSNGNANIAKPILLLTILRMIDRGELLGNRIVYNDLLKDRYVATLNGYTKDLTPLRYPFYYMRNDGSYHIMGLTNLKTPSEGYILRNISYAYLDPELWDLLQDPQTRDEFREAIISHYLKPDKEK